MSITAALTNSSSDKVLSSLKSVCDSQGLGDLSLRLGQLAELVHWDMKDLEQALDTIPRTERVVHKSANHLLDQGGKRLRPMCVALAARCGDGFSPEARELALAVEFVHCATLLHDDVVDFGDTRRGAPAARTLYGNAASIFAGDWLLVEALRRVRATRVPGTLDRLLDIIDEMIIGESIQLENKRRIDIGRESYFDIVDRKTAALFRWAMFAGGRAGGLEDEACEALEGYGKHLGVAFQLIDDLLDYSGDVSTLGKEPFIDLREGKMTYPLIVALEREPALRGTLEAVMALPAEQAPDAKTMETLTAALERTSALEDCRKLAYEHADRAAAQIADFEAGPARTALLTIAEATVHRDA